MSVKKFKFVSPGIFINEIDNSHLPKSPLGVGPIIIGRSERGPAMRPVKVDSFSEFVELFGEPIPGGKGDDVYREGNYLAPTYAAYAAQAWLRNQSPITFVRLLGTDHQDATGTMAGWRTTTARPGAYGLFIADAPTGALQAQADIEIAGCGTGELGVLSISMNSDAAGGADGAVTIVEQSATKKALIVDFSNAANLQEIGGVPGTNNDRIIITLPDATTKQYDFGNGVGVPNTQGDGSGLVMQGLAVADMALRFATYINDVDSEVFEATRITGSAANSAVMINILTPGATGDPGVAADLTAICSLQGGGGGAALCLDMLRGDLVSTLAAAQSDADLSSRSCFNVVNDGRLAAASVGDQAQGFSLRLACVSAGVNPMTLNAAGGPVDDEMAAALIAAAAAMIAASAALHAYTLAAGASAQVVVATKTTPGAGAGGVMNTGTWIINASAGGAVPGPLGLGFVNGSDQSANFGKAALAAIFYNASTPNDTTLGHLLLEGQTIGGEQRSQCGVFLESVGADYEFRMRIRNNLDGSLAGGAEDTSTEVVNFNFEPSSKKYIRKVFNTNPTLTNTGIVDNGQNFGVAGGNLRSYWLGETFDKHLEDTLNTNGPLEGRNNVGVAVGSQAAAAAAVLVDRLRPLGAATTAAGAQVACLLELGTRGAVTRAIDVGDYIEEARPPQSGWVFSQHQGLPENFLLDDASGEYPETWKLFRLVGLYSGEWDQSNLKVSIDTIRPSTNPDANPYGTFTLSLRKSNDLDKSPQFVERFTGLSLDPNSPNYIGARIGDMETFWVESERRYRTVGQYDNKSQFVRVEVNADLEAGLLDPTLLPFGFYGPPKYADVRASQDEDLYTLGRMPSGGWAAVSTAITRNLSIVQGATSATIDGTAYNVINPGFPSLEDAVNCTATSQALDGEQRRVIAGSNELADDGTSLNAGDASASSNRLYFDGANGSTAQLVMPSLRLRQNTRDGGLARPQDCYWGVEPSRKGSTTRIDPGYGDYVRSLGAATGGMDRSTNGTAGQEHMHPAYSFSLDNIQLENQHGSVGFGPAIPAANGGWNTGAAWNNVDGISNTHAEYLDENHDGLATATAGGGSTAAERLLRGAASARRMGSSLSSLVSPATGMATQTYENTLNSGFDRFTMPLWGGQDGLDLTQKEPFSNLALQDMSDITHYAYNSVKRAIDACADPEVVECNIMAMPGITESTLTDHLIATCEARADALAIIDLPGRNTGGGEYSPNTENTVAERLRLPNVDAAVLELQDRVLSSSYGCTYFPWVQIRDQINNALVWVPPSVVALGTMSNSQKETQLWFAPAGFTRGGLSDGAAGLPVINVRHRLNSEERDKLYEANINPIASFPAEGIVVFGQKTLQAEASALDRINVRRLMIYLKKEISRMAATVLFDQNVKATWGRFTSEVNPFLQTVKSQFGLTEYKVILDETTTTPDLIDRNIMYAKIMLKPARAIEFIAIDFVITNSGASFDD